MKRVRLIDNATTLMDDLYMWRAKMTEQLYEFK